jgi:diguanylate cyclase (GGDEF)-like protein/PAS domain S-box-containing protein
MKAHRQKPLLIVDDEPLNRDMLSRRLIKAGLAVETAANAQEALARIEQSGIEMVLLDYMMPGMNGIELLRLLRATHSESELPVIMVTADGESARVVEALECGANDFITKPIDFPVAMARIGTELKRKRSEERVRESEQRYALALEAASEGIWDLDLRTESSYFSPGFLALLDLSPEQIRGLDVRKLWLERIDPEDRGLLEKALAREADFQIELRLRTSATACRWLSCRGSFLRDSDGHAIRSIGSLTDNTNGRALDPITGLPNRIMLEELLQQQLRSAAHGSLILVRLEDLRLVGESLGESGSQFLLKEASERLRGLLLQQDWLAEGCATLCRSGEEEFAILYSVAEKPEEESAVAFCWQIQDVMQQTMVFDTKEFSLQAGCGVLVDFSGYRHHSDCLRDAGRALNSALARGRGSSEVFRAGSSAMILQRISMESELRKGLAAHQFETWYQPIVQLDTGTLKGFESLVRWRHPLRGLVSPLEFVPIAEQSDLIVELGLYVLQSACAQMARWRASETWAQQLEVSVNLSVRQLTSPTLLLDIDNTLRQNNLPANSLSLEVTESVVLEDPQTAEDILRALRDKGIGLKVDDFGTGYSSLSYLHRLPFDTLKIDRSFVFRMTEDRASATLVRTLLDMASELELDTVAEGIETEKQKEWLGDMGCIHGQGYLFSRPLPANEIEAWMQRRMLQPAD